MLAAWAWIAAALWLGLLLVPWRPASTREQLDAESPSGHDLSDITVLIPARNEAATLPRTLTALAAESSDLRIIVVDDQSNDNTATVARAISLSGLAVIDGEPLPPGWTGKLWALEQGRRRASTGLLLLLDADITLAPGILSTLHRKLIHEDLALVSLMAQLRMQTWAERWLLPAFVFFFKLVYPFALANRTTSSIAAAAGGCILLRRNVLESVGGFGALRDALIDDCALAYTFKRAGHRAWLGLTHSARCHRAHASTREIWRMIERNAFTQLRYSFARLLAVSTLFVVAFVVPIAAVLSAAMPTAIAGAAALIAMGLAMAPTLIYYGLSLVWAPVLPFTAMFFLAITWSSAIRYWRGERSAWRGRRYGPTLEVTPPSGRAGPIHGIDR